MGAPTVVEIASGVIGPLTKAFEDAGFTPPNVTFTESESSLTLIVQGAKVSGTHQLTQDFISDYWRGKLLFSEVHHYIGGDSLTVTISAHHQAGDHRPHEPDALKGTQCPLQVTVDSSIEKGTTAEKESKKEVSHPSVHSDSYNAKLTATIVQGHFSNDIIAWNFELRAGHNDRAPIAMTLRPDTAGALAGVAKVAILANEHVHTVANLSLVLEYDRRLAIERGDIDLGPFLAAGTTNVDVETPGQVRLQFQSRAPVHGPGLLAVLTFHLPGRNVMMPSYDVVCVRIRATDEHNRVLELGCDDCTIRLPWTGTATT